MNVELHQSDSVHFMQRVLTTVVIQPILPTSFQPMGLLLERHISYHLLHGRDSFLCGLPVQVLRLRDSITVVGEHRTSNTRPRASCPDRRRSAVCGALASDLEPRFRRSLADTEAH